MRRRRVLAATASGCTLALAGCFSNAETESPRSVVRAYLEAEHDEGDREAMAALLHSESPLDPTAGDESLDPRNIEIDTISVERRGLSVEQIESLNMGLDAETAAAIGERENALVEATYETDPPELPDDSGRTGLSGRITVQTTYLTAMEGNDWLVVAFQLL